MTNEQIQQWADEAGIGWASGLGGMDKFLQAFATLVRNATLEEAADVVDNADTPDCGGWSASGIAEDIRAMK